MSFKNWDPDQVSMIFRGIPFLMFMDSTFISAERAEDGFSMSVGAKGDTTRVRSRNKSGSVTATLQAASPSNDLLSATYQQDELFGFGYGPLMVKHFNGNTLISSPYAWIRKLPTVEFADENSGREWVLDCNNLFMFVGGSIF